MKFSFSSLFICLFTPLICLSQNQVKEIEPNLDNLLLKANLFYNNADYDSSIAIYKTINNGVGLQLKSEEYFELKIKMIDSYLKNGDFPNAISELTKTLRHINERDYSDSLHFLMLNYLDGEIKYKTGKYDQSRRVLNKCMANINQSGLQYDSLKVLILKSLGNIELKSGNINNALNIYKNAKNIEIKRRNSPGPLLGSVYLNLALAYDQIKEIDSADAYFLRSIEVKSRYAKDKSLLASSYNNYSNYLINFGKTKKALYYLNMADSLYKKKHGADFYKLALVYLNYAKIYLLNNDYRKALNYFTKSENIYRKYLPKNDNESPRRKRTGYHDGLFVLLFAPRGGELNPKRLNSRALN
jgi:tetratricopeptide (TPR) repeat protein